jgi:Lysylphosphatidylglycerol synthase TM region
VEDRPRGLRHRLRQWLPWLAAAALLAWLTARVPVDALRAALRHGSYLPLAVYVVFETLAILPLDVFATREALSIAAVRRGFSELFLLRGATYLLGLLSYVAGQGGVGVYLARSGVRASRAAGAMLFLMITNGIVLVAIAALGLLADLPAERRDLLLALIFGALAGIAVYLAVLAARPRWLADRPPLAPLFEAGVRGHLRAAAARVPHLLLMAVLQWGAYRVWGIPIPFWRSLALMTVVLLVAALPITPSGLGTSQVLQVLFFSPWAAGAGAAARGADVLALSLVHYVFGLVCQALVGVVCLAGLRRAGIGKDLKDGEDQKDSKDSKDQKEKDEKDEGDGAVDPALL